MKNAAKCDTQCELQNRESSDLWTQVAVAPATMFISVYPVNYIKELNVIEVYSLTKYGTASADKLNETVTNRW
jgi:hypothetical protein